MKKNKIDALQLVCLRCGHKWLKRKLEDPMFCPKCRSPYWNKPRKKIIEGGEKTDA